MRVIAIAFDGFIKAVLCTSLHGSARAQAMPACHPTVASWFARVKGISAVTHASLVLVTVKYLCTHYSDDVIILH